MTIKYLHVIHSLDPRSGGPAEAVKQISAAATRLDHQVEIATLDAPAKPWTQDYQCPVHCLGPAYLKYGYAPKLKHALRSMVPRFDAVIVNGIWQYHSFCAWQVLRRSHVPYYVFPHGMLDPWFKQRYPLKHLKKQIYWPWADYRVLRDARAVLFTAEAEKRSARDSFGRYRANEIVTNLGVPAPQGDPDAQREIFLTHFPQLRGKRLLLFLGRLHPKKGCELLVRAFAQIAGVDASFRLVMAGPDQLDTQRALLGLASHLNVQRAITWTGMLTGDIKLGAFRAAEAFVLPSHQENFGLSVAEALACGVPVLISDKVNICQEILRDEAGLVAEDTLAGTIRMLQAWLRLDVAERSRVAHNALVCYRSRFDSDAAARGLMTVLERGVEQRRAA